MHELQGGLIGCGHFATNHLHAWRDVVGARLSALCDLDARRAHDAAASFGVPAVYDSAEEMLESEQLDFVDIVTQPGSHRPLVELAAQRGVPVICQKPLAPEMEDAEQMVGACRAAGVRLMVHENFRWPMRALKAAADELGRLFFMRLTFRSGFDVYASQPYLATDDRFIVYDLGVHLLDLARFLLGEAESVYAQTQRVNPSISGEDAATIVLRMRTGATCIVELSYGSTPHTELFPQTLVHLEGAAGTATLGPAFELTVTTDAGTRQEDAGPQLLPWATPPAHAIQESVVAIQQHWVDCLREGRTPETSGADNLRTLALVFAAYASADSGQVLHFSESEAAS